MIDNFVFLHNSWLVLVSILTVILWGVFMWKEGSIFPKAKFWLHSFIALITVGALALIALKPARILPSHTKKVVLLTPGYNPQQLDSLKKKYNKIDIYTYTANSPIFKETNNDSVFLLGQGIETYDLWQLKNHNVSYLGAPQPSGVIRFLYQPQNIIGTSFICKGVYKNPTPGRTLILQGPGGIALDSVTLEPMEEQKFSLQTPLKLNGRFLYKLIEKDAEGTIFSEDPIPVLVNDPSVLKVLIINGFPTFETKYLKNYLAEMGHQVLLRSQLTKGKYKYEYLNMTEKPMVRLDEKSLKPFDVLIIDAVSLKSMTRTTRKNLENTMRKHGLGVFIQSDLNYFRFSVSPATFNFTADNVANTKIEEIQVNQLDRYPFYFKNEFGIQKIHTSLQNKTISAYRHIGKGKVGTTTLHNTYQLLLEGKSITYHKIWSDLMSTMSNKQIPKVDWEFSDVLINKDEPFLFKFRTKISEPAVVKDDHNRIPLLEDFDVSGYWEGTIYPKTLGWNTLRLQQDTTTIFPYFVMSAEKWKPKRINDIISVNQRIFSKKNEKQKASFFKEPINPIIFYAIFIVCISYLWIEPKLNW